MATKALKAFVLIIAIIIFPDIVNFGQYQCTRVTDEDIITVVTGDQKLTIRLVGIDAPEKSRKKQEPRQPFSRASTKYLAGMVLNKDVDIKTYGTEPYGRSLRVVYDDGTNVNLENIKEGLAEVYRGKPVPGFVNGPYRKAGDEARSAGIRMWSLGDKYISPKDWRKMNGSPLKVKWLRLPTGPLERTSVSS